MSEFDQALGQQGYKSDRYHAFICCAVEDDEWAGWLTQQLESFRVPVALQQQGYPKKIGDLHTRIFESVEDELSENDLEILGESQYVIVLCSPAAVRSEGISQVIQKFRDAGRGSQILSLLLDGSSFKASPSELIHQCYSSQGQQLSGHKLWSRLSSAGADLRKRPGVSEGQLQKMAVLRLTAKLLRCPYYRLYQHESSQASSQYLPKRKMPVLAEPTKATDSLSVMSVDQSYKAFICSSPNIPNRDDLHWLRHTLDSFKTPKSLARNGYAENLGKVYQDIPDVDGGELSDETLSILRRSDWLLLVCCADTLNSLRVQSIVEQYFAWGRHDRVIALLTDGASSQVLPSLLRHIAGHHSIWYKTGVTSFDIRSSWDKTDDEVRKVAFHRVAAKLLQCRYYRLCSALELDEQIEQKELQEKVEYFGNMVRSWSIPKGLEPLDYEKRLQRNTLYRANYSQGRLVSMVCEDSRGHLKVDDEQGGAASWTVEYRKDGSLKYVFVRGVDGALIQRESYSKDLSVVDFDDHVSTTNGGGHGLDSGLNSGSEVPLSRNRHLPIALQNPVSRPKKTSVKKRAITRHQLEYDVDGYVTFCLYLNARTNRPMKDSVGAYGVGYRIGKLGLPEASWLLNKHNRPLKHLKFETKVVMARNEMGQIIRQQYVDGHDQLVKSIHGVAGVDRDYDDFGNLIKESFFDPKECLVESLCGYAQVVYHYDSKGGLLAKEYYDRQGKQVTPHKPVQRGLKGFLAYLFRQ